MSDVKIRLTEDEKNILNMFLLMTTNYRKKEKEAWESLGRELDEHGNIEFPNSASNALWWLSTEETLQGILRKLNDFDNLKHVDEDKHEKT